MAPYWKPLVDRVRAAKGARIGDPTAPCFCHGRFEIDHMIGCGGMGIVFKARDPELDRDVALKLWNLEGEQAEAALRNEAQCQAKVAHPNVATIYETGKIGDDVYLAMEYVQGTDARRWMNKSREPWQYALSLFICAGQGLAAVHKRGLVHADFKPENLLIGVDGRVLVADFGIARVLREHEAEQAEDAGRGTKVYMAPERLEWRGGDARSDQFSFCVSLWECMYGARPFSGETRAELLASMRAGELRTGAKLPGVPRRLRKILIAGLAMDPARRFASVDALLVALGDVSVVRVRRVRAAVAGAALLGAGMVGANLAGDADGPEPQKESFRVIPHLKVGITSGPEATAPKEPADPSSDEEIELQPAEPRKPPDTLSDEEIVGSIDGFSVAMSTWRRRRGVQWIRGISSEELSLKVAQAYLANAERLEGTEPSAAMLLARYAEQVASSVFEDHEPTQAGLYLADDIASKANHLLIRLKKAR